MDRVCTLTLKDTVTMTPLIAEHKAILAAIDAHDADAAAEAMRVHPEPRAIGTPVTRKRVERIMREHRISGKHL